MSTYNHILKTILIVISLIAYGQLKSQTIEKSTIDKIVIQFFPVFHTNSQIIYDVKNDDMIYDMIGDVVYIKVDGNYDIKPFYHKFNSAESQILNDSILAQFKIDDFSDSHFDAEDGMTIDILFVFADGKTKKIELLNSSTTNQSRLISFLLETVIDNCPDNETIEYSRLIKEY